MKTKIVSFLLLLLPVASWGGEHQPMPVPVRAPALEDGGLLMLALALAGTGLTLLRRNKR